jgi:hypothetical protein
MDRPQMPPKTVALVAAVCLTAGWILAAVLTPPVANLQVLPERRTAAPPTEDQEIASGFAEQLKQRLRKTPEPPRPRRNPFRFGAPEPVRDAQPARAAAPRALDLPTTPEVTPVAVGPAYTLSGMGVSESPEGTTRTAVLTDGRTVHLVKVGDQLGGYTVTEMTDRSVTLTDVAGAKYTLALR